MNFILRFLLIFVVAFGASAKTISDNKLTFGDKTTSEKNFFLGLGGQNIIRVPSGGGNIEISNNGGSSFDDISAGEQANEPNSIENGAVLTSVAASALTVALKQSDASTDPTTPSPVRVGMRVTPLTSGAFNSRTVEAALSIVVPSGATLNHADGADGFIYVYLLDNAGVLEIAVSSVIKDESILQTSQTIGAGSDDDDLFSTVGRSDVPIRLIARLKSNQVTAGTWLLNMSEIVPGGEINSLATKISSSSINRQIEHANVSAGDCVSSPCTLTNKSDNIVSITRGGVGSYSVNFETGTWASAPHCVCNDQRAGSLLCETNTPTISVVGVNTRNSSTSSVTDGRPSVVCIGER